MKNLYPISLQDKLQTSLKLFDSVILPVITHGSEIWGHLLKNTNNCIELFHIKFCKHILGIGRMASNSATKAELGRFPIINHIIPRILKYYNHLNNCNNDIIKR